MWSLPGPRPVKKFRTLRRVQLNWFRTVRWMMFPSFLKQHTHVTTSRIHIHHFHADTARMLVAECDPFCARPACFENRCCWLDSGYMLTVFTR